MHKKFLRVAGLSAVFMLLSACAGLSTEKQGRLDSLEKNAYNTLTEVRKKLEENPQSALDESLTALDAILNYADSVKSDPDRFSDDKMKEYADQIQIINENIKRFKDLTLQTDVSFGSGHYKLEHLSASGRRAGDELVEKISTVVNELMQKYPGRRVRVTLKIAGYTDETPIVSGSRLEKELRVRLGEDAPKGGVELRGAYNKELAALRTETLGNYLSEHLQKKLVHDNVEISPRFIGKGEEYPLPEIQPPYRRQDGRRRICIISPFIEIIL